MGGDDKPQEVDGPGRAWSRQRTLSVLIVDSVSSVPKKNSRPSVSSQPLPPIALLVFPMRCQTCSTTAPSPSRIC